MGVSTEVETPARLLGLGNEILADDAFGILVAQRVRRCLGDAADVVWSSESGFNLIDQLLGTSRLLIVDTIVTGKAKPGTIHTFGGDHIRPLRGQSPHFVGIFEVLALARKLGLCAPSQVTVVAVEAADCFTVGGAMHPGIRSAVPLVAERAMEFLRTPCHA